MISFDEGERGDFYTVSYRFPLFAYNADPPLPPPFPYFILLRDCTGLIITALSIPRDSVPRDKLLLSWTLRETNEFE